MSEWKTAAAYIRVSTEEQADLSPDSQWEAIQSYAVRRQYRIPPECVFVDEGLSGRTAAKRPAFRRMIAAARGEERPFSCILVWKFSRFARNQEESVVYKALLRKEGVDVVSVSEPLIEGPFGGLIERVLEWMDEYYSVRLSGEVRRSMTLNARRGVRQIAPPYGYTLTERDGKRVMVPEAREAELVREVFARFLDGEGLSSLARRLNALGARTHRGNRFESRTVEYLLRNPVYVGKLRWTPTGKIRRAFDCPDAIIADAGHEAIVDAETWNAAQERVRTLKARRERGERPPREARDWLSGVVRCASCGATLTLEKPYYVRCNNYARGRCASSQRVRADALREALTGRLRDDMRGAGALRYRLSDADSDGGEARRLSLALGALERKLSRLQDAYAAGADSLEEYRKRKRELERERAALSERLTALRRDADREAMEAGIREAVRNPVGALERSDISIEQKREALRSVLASCTFDRERMTLRVVYRVPEA